MKFLGKLGVVIDEGVDGIIDRLMPDGMGMDDDEKKILKELAKKGAERARMIEEAAQRYDEAAKRFEAATLLRDKRMSQALPPLTIWTRLMMARPRSVST